MKKKLFINGEWCESKGNYILKSPYSGEDIAEVPLASESEVHQALDAAFKAQSVMAAMPSHRRAGILYEVSRLLEERSGEAARLIALEAAKPVATAEAEVDRTVQTYRFAAEEAKRIHGETLPLDAAPGGEGRIAYTVREPIGVIGAITPFNFPMNLVAHKLGPAIAAGNAVVLKPANQTPLSAFMIAELFEEAGLPAGALNVVTGQGRIIGDVIVTDPRVKMLTFTGSPEVGIGIRNRAGLKKVTLELGSNAAVIIDRDADVKSIIDRCVTSAFSFQGQICISLQRVYVHAEIYEVFVREFVEATKRLKHGDPLSPDTQVSALITPKDAERTLEWIEEARRQGATIAAGAERIGNIVLPTVILNAPAAARVSCQEVFGPVVVINKVDSLDEAIERVNDSRFGLQAGIYTNNIHHAFTAADRLRVGGVMINDTPTFRVDHMPYGGVKDSGTGREGVKFAVEEMTELKLITIKR